MSGSGHSNGINQIWDVATGNPLTTLSGHTARIETLAFSPDGKILASGGTDGQVMVSEVGTNPNPLIFKERHAWRVKVLVFSSDGKHLVSGSRDNSIRLWDTEIGVGRTVLREHTGEVKALAFSTDGTTLISGSIDGTILSSDWERIIKKKDK